MDHSQVHAIVPCAALPPLLFSPFSAVPISETSSCSFFLPHAGKGDGGKEYRLIVDPELCPRDQPKPKKKEYVFFTFSEVHCIFILFLLSLLPSHYTRHPKVGIPPPDPRTPLDHRAISNLTYPLFKVHIIVFYFGLSSSLFFLNSDTSPDSLHDTLTLPFMHTHTHTHIYIINFLSIYPSIHPSNLSPISLALHSCTQIHTLLCSTSHPCHP